MSKSNIHKKQTKEDKFGRKYWVNNKAKRSWVRWIKHRNNKLIRRANKEECKDD